MKIMNGEFILGYHYKLRYYKILKIEIYKFINREFNQKISKAIIYVSMKLDNI
jgi:spore photoproduct lyase